jgi:hypothetical protein
MTSTRWRWIAVACFAVAAVVLLAGRLWLFAIVAAAVAVVLGVTTARR